MARVARWLGMSTEAFIYDRNVVKLAQIDPLWKMTTRESVEIKEESRSWDDHRK